MNMYEIYQKYILLLKIKKLKYYKLKLKINGVYGFMNYLIMIGVLNHIKNYIHLIILEFWLLYNNFISLHNGMFF